MTVWQPDPFLLFSWPHFFPLRLAKSLSKYTVAPAEGLQPDFLQHEAALKLLWKQIFLGHGRMMWKSDILLSPAPTAHRKWTLLCSKNKLSQSLLADESALAYRSGHFCSISFFYDTALDYQVVPKHSFGTIPWGGRSSSHAFSPLFSGCSYI